MQSFYAVNVVLSPVLGGQANTFCVILASGFNYMKNIVFDIGKIHHFVSGTFLNFKLLLQHHLEL